MFPLFGGVGIECVLSRQLSTVGNRHVSVEYENERDCRQMLDGVCANMTN